LGDGDSIAMRVWPMAWVAAHAGKTRIPRTTVRAEADFLVDHPVLTPTRRDPRARVIYWVFSSGSRSRGGASNRNRLTDLILCRTPTSPRKVRLSDRQRRFRPATRTSSLTLSSSPGHRSRRLRCWPRATGHQHRYISRRARFKVLVLHNSPTMPHMGSILWWINSRRPNGVLQSRECFFLIKRSTRCLVLAKPSGPQLLE